MAESHIFTSFQVYVLRNSRWEIYARFGEEDRIAAVRLGKKVSRNPNVMAVRVIKDVYDEYADVAEEHVVYKSRRTGPPPTRAPETSARVSRTEYALAQKAYREAQLAAAYARKIDTLPRGAVPKALSGTLMAFVLAALSTGILAYLFGGTTPDTVSTTQTSGLVVIFTVSLAVILAVSFAIAVVIAPDTGSAAKAWKRIQRRMAKAGQKHDPHIEAEPQMQTAAPQSFPIRRKKRGVSLPKDAAKQLKFIKVYLRKTVGPLRGAYDLNDAYTKFGINLFAAGVTEALCQEREIQPEIAQKVMGGAIRALGVSPEQADGFSGAYVEYLISDPRYMDMFASGREAVLGELAGRAESLMALHLAVEKWLLPSTPPEEKLNVTVMFTSITGFDDLLADRGDEVAHDALRLHASIANRALTEYGGKRIKMLQSGIMAAFMSADNALRAAFVIRDGMREHSKKNLELPLSANIGINCGEPVVEGNDLFGVTVQLAARIVAIAKGGEILVSPAIQEAIGPVDDVARLEPYGPFAMKGFTDPITLYRVVFTAQSVKPVKANQTGP